ncbi:putative membrane protein, predicted efflux pump [Handroanthus impetiginosus]|uniref:Protein DETOXIFICATION n=1 Tax=Handroanthus impetiginosus TaxID=429701 RepID=A0A2G9GHY3_9LAMI|nr:putative membrane protein, predicted efflux pump [Handroanthus impetiginosus]PIN07652.1 putative membrane protein, predicted efflux pump [Handroanthus impetiginosus]
MNLKTLNHRFQFQCPHIQIPKQKFYPKFSSAKTSLRIVGCRSKRLTITNCSLPSSETENVAEISLTEEKNGVEVAVVEKMELYGEVSENNGKELLENGSLWDQVTDIVKFSGPAVGLWLCGPLMGLIDTAVVGQGSSIELAALGPGTVLCDYTSYLFMFLSIATSNLVATSLAKQDKNEVQHQISILLFVGLACGTLMFFFTKFLGRWALTAFTGAKNADIISAANKYVQIRGFVWPVWLVGWVAQSASLGMKDSWGPVKALAVASAINGVGDVVLCRFLGFGIAGAAWATMVSQAVAAFMMIWTLNQKGYNGFAISIPSPKEFLQIFMLAAPAFVAILSKIVFYALLVYFATSMGTHSVAAHQVMVQLYCICAVWGEPLSQTAQSFMPELIYGPNRSLAKVRKLLKTLVIIGALSGLILGSFGTSLPWLFPKIFSSDPEVIREMHKVLIPFFVALFAAPPINCLEGTLMAGRDLKFLSLSMTGITCLGTVLLLVLSKSGYGLTGCWFALVAFQLSLFAVLLQRLALPDGILYSDDLTRYEIQKLKTV